jgi:hypothetical protein
MSRRTPSSGTIDRLLGFSLAVERSQRGKTILATGVLRLREKFATRTFLSAQDDRVVRAIWAFLHHSRCSYNFNT